MQTTFDHKFALDQEVYVQNNEAGIMKGTISEITYNVYYSPVKNLKAVKYIVKTRYKSTQYLEESVFATMEEAFK
jgi:hypothetical protein